MRAIKNSIFLYIAYIWNFLGGFIQLKILVWDLSKEALGKYFFAGGVGILIGSIAQIGFPYVFQRFIPRYDHEKRQEDKLTLIWFSLMFHLIIMLVSLPFMFFAVGKNLPYTLIYIGFYLVSHMDLFFNVYISQRRAEPVTILKGIYYIILIIMLLSMRPLSIIKVSYSLITSTVFVLILTYIHLPLPSSMSLNNVKRVFLEIKEYFSYALYTHLLGPFFMYIDRIMIPFMLGYEALGIFQIARKLEQGARGFLFVPISAFAPELSKLYEEENHEASKRVLKKLTLVYALSGALISILFIVLGKPLIILVSSKKYLLAYPHLIILMISFFFSLLYAPYTTYRRARDGMDFFFKINAIWLLSFLVFILFTFKKLHLYAFSFGMLFATLVVLLYSLIDWRKYTK